MPVAGRGSILPVPHLSQAGKPSPPLDSFRGACKHLPNPDTGWLLAFPKLHFPRKMEPLPGSAPARSIDLQYSSGGEGICAAVTPEAEAPPPHGIALPPSMQGPGPYALWRGLEQFSLLGGIVLPPRETGLGTNRDFPARDSSRSSLARR